MASGIVVADDGVVLPASSIGLLGSSTEGGHAVAEFGFMPGFFEADYAALRDELRARSTDESAVILAVSERIAELARTARGWVSLRTTVPDGAPSIVVVGERTLIVAHLLGSTVEWLAGDTGLLERMIRAEEDRYPGGTLELTAFRAGEAFAALRITNQAVDVAARDADILDLLSQSAASGLSALVGALLGAFADSSRSFDKSDVISSE